MKSIKVLEKNEGMYPVEIEYSVNDSGNGLWYNGKQIIGTCDFSAHSEAELMRKIKNDEGVKIGMKTIKKIRNSGYGWK